MYDRYRDASAATWAPGSLEPGNMVGGHRRDPKDGGRRIRATTVTATVTPTPASPASATNLAFGQAIERPGSARMTVSDFKAFAKGNHDTPLAGAMVQGCSIGSDPIEFSSYPWTLATADGSTFEPMGTFYGNDPVPQYPSQRVVAAGQCVKGWILYELPAGTAITTIRYSNSSSDTPLLGTWKVA